MNKLILHIILLATPFLVNSQIVSDAKLWTEISIGKKIQKFDLSLSQGYRMDENISHTDKVFTEFGVEYKIIKSLSGGFNYRFARENKYEDYSYDLNHRFEVGLEYEYKIKGLKIRGEKVKGLKVKYSIKCQLKTAPLDNYNPTYLRNEFTLQYKKNNFTPYVSYEFYYQLNNENVINRTRISGGLKYEINKKNSIKGFYIFENKFNTKNLKHNHIYGIGYSFDL